MRNLLGPISEIYEDECLSWNVNIAPCQAGCPLKIDVEGYVSAIGRGDFDMALDIIKRECPLPAVCAYICYAPCEGACKRGRVDEAIAIMDLKRAAVNFSSRNEPKERPQKTQVGEKIAVVGSGPAGLSCAFFLAKGGYRVTIFEASPFIGGMLRIGIPEYRLPKDVLDMEIEEIKRQGVEIQTDTPITKDFSINEIFHRGYKAIFIGTGAHKGKKLEIPGENSWEVLPGLDFLRRLNTGGKIEIGKRVAVIGGGNVAIDAARCARRLGASVSILYRRSKEEMPANDKEIRGAEDEGIKIDCLLSPVEVHTVNGKIKSLNCVKMKLGDVDSSGRRKSMAIEGSEFSLDVDMVIPAIGETPELSFIEKEWGIEITEQQTIKVDPGTLATTQEGVFAGGDVQSGPYTAISAMADGKKAAASINNYLRGKRIIEEVSPGSEVTMSEVMPRNIIMRQREEIHELPTVLRTRGFKEVNLGFTPDQAMREGKRCLRCKTCNKCMEKFDCVAILPRKNNSKLSPRIDQDLCVGCQVCIQVCPYGSIHQKEM